MDSGARLFYRRAPAMNHLLLVIHALAAVVAAEEPMMHRENYAKTPAGETVERFTLTNRHGMVARLITWGASLCELHVPDRDGKMDDVTLGFDDPARWVQPHPFFGCIAGRYANRIAKGKFTLDGETFTLAKNDGPNHLHGGVVGFDKRNWRGEPAGENAVRFHYTSPAAEEGYPGTLEVSVTYTLTDDNALRLDYSATTDAPTVLNLTNHAYFNLSGGPDILSHELKINARHYTEVDAESIPTGKLPAVDRVMDFTTAKPIGRDIAALKDAPGGGYDHNWVIPEWKSGQLADAAELFDPKSGRVMKVATTQPGLQFYSGNYLKSVAGKGGRVYEKHAGLCLETQHFPDSPNYPSFPTTVLRPGETFQSTTIYRFSTR
jgi:aldose 1-epimerase